MPRRLEPTLGDDLVDAYRALTTEILDRLAAAGFPDLPQAATTVFRDIDGRGSLVTDLAYGAGLSPEIMKSIVDDLAARGYVEFLDDGRVRPAERGHKAFTAGRRAVADAEERWAARLGPERYDAFRASLRELASREP
jgi:DNA-binding MarR family transcriptional regulator